MEYYNWLSSMSLPYLLLLLFIHSQVVFIHSSSSSPQCHPHERSALLQFKSSFSIHTSYGFCLDTEHNSTASWVKRINCCAWSGITCDQLTGHVIGIDLRCANLQGTISCNNSLFLLRHLQRLDLSFNDFRGSPVLSEFSQFKNLTHLNLLSSDLRGRIPFEISHLSKLISLQLSDITMGASTFKALAQNLTNLRELRLYNIDMSSVPLVSLMNLSSSLTNITLSNCKLQGKLPENIFQRPKLVSLQLSPSRSQNIAIGASTFKALAQNLTNLRELRLYNIDMSSVPLVSLMNLSSSLTFLILGDCNLQGKLPEDIFRMPKLQVLYLYNNEGLSGSFPKSNWSSSLQALDLSGTALSIDLPLLLNNARSLSNLSLSNCNFVGSNTVLLSNFTQIVSLDLSFNNLSGQIPWSFFHNHNRLEVLYLSSNNFIGQLPEVDSNLTQNFSSYDSSKYLVAGIPLSLRSLSLYSNSLNGTIPSWIYALPHLDYLDLSSNLFTGEIVEFHSISLSELLLGKNNFTINVKFLEKLSRLQTLRSLDLSSINLSTLSLDNSVNYTFDNLWYLSLSLCNISEFPHFLKFSKSLYRLDLSNNRIQGGVPKWLWEVGKNSLDYLNLSHNSLTYIEPLQWNKLRTLDLRSNSFSGPLPISSRFSWYFFVSNNQFLGEIPTSLCNMKRVEVLDLSYNNLSGEIPECMGNFSEDLSVLDLRGNKLHGAIPRMFAKGNHLRNLNLNGNRLEGTLPQSLLTCKNLEVLDLGDNRINDTFPHWLESLPRLQVLILRSNKFHGSIANPKVRLPFRKLRIMDIAHNEFNGPLPGKYFENLMAMVHVDGNHLKYMGESYYDDSVAVVIKGEEIMFEKILNIWTTIDFSQNNFEGEIPKSIGKLKSLKGLNFSQNKLSGHIPPSLGNLSELEWLDLSSNKLDGEIPLQLADLTQLEKLNLSQNKLVGHIPGGKQFNTFDNDSYSGNSGLCGSPLSQPCSKDEAQKPSPSSDEESDEFDWKFVVMMGYGCGLVIGISVGYIVLSNSEKLDYWIAKRTRGRGQQRKTPRRPIENAHLRGRRRRN